MTIYLVKHGYSVDGGFGDAVWTEVTVTAFTKEEDAKAFVACYSNEHVYDKPYAELVCGGLTVVPMEVETEFTKDWEWVVSYFGDYLKRKEVTEGEPT